MLEPECQALANLRRIAQVQAAAHPDDPAIAFLAGYVAGRLEAPPASQLPQERAQAGVA